MVGIGKPNGGMAELVDCTGLENRRAARHRGFESLSLRNYKFIYNIMIRKQKTYKQV